jgi:hypothetical protein
MAEQGNISIRNMSICYAAVPSVPDRGLGEEVVLPRVDLSAVRRGRGVALADGGVAGGGGLGGLMFSCFGAGSGCGERGGDVC